MHLLENFDIFDLHRESKNGNFPQSKFSGHSPVNNIERFTGRRGQEESWPLYRFKIMNCEAYFKAFGKSFAEDCNGGVLNGAGVLVHIILLVLI